MLSYTLLGALVAILGMVFGANWMIGVGILLFLLGGGVGFFAGFSLPSYIWVFAILLFIWWLSKKK